MLAYETDGGASGGLRRHGMGSTSAVYGERTARTFAYMSVASAVLDMVADVIAI